MTSVPQPSNKLNNDTLFCIYVLN